MFTHRKQKFEWAIRFVEKDKSTLYFSSSGATSGSLV